MTANALGAPRQATSRRLIAAAVIVGCVVIVATLVAAEITDRSAGIFTRDVRVIANEGGLDLPPYVGMLGLLNVMVWAVGGALALCAAALVPERRLWAGVLGLLLLTLGVDDALMLHEGAGNKSPYGELAFYAFYAVAGAWLLQHSVRHHRDDTTSAFIVGALFLALSSAIDLAVRHRYLAEDGTKLIGALIMVTVPIPMLWAAALELRALHAPTEHNPKNQHEHVQAAGVAAEMLTHTHGRRATRRGDR